MKRWTCRVSLARDAREGSLSVYHLVEDAPERPDVGGAANLERATQRARLPVENRLGGHVVHRSNLVIAHDVGGVRLAGIPREESFFFFLIYTTPIIFRLYSYSFFIRFYSYA